jgi:hypothetical protein
MHSNDLTDNQLEALAGQLAPMVAYFHRLEDGATRV